MFKLSDIFILLAVGLSFIVSAYLWFAGEHEAGIFTSLWVPSILCFAIYFKLLSFIEITNREKDHD